MDFYLKNPNIPTKSQQVKVVKALGEYPKLKVAKHFK